MTTKDNRDLEEEEEQQVVPKARMESLTRKKAQTPQVFQSSSKASNSRWELLFSMESLPLPA